MEHQTALAQLQTSIAKARGDEAEALALAEAARRDRDACASLHDVEHRSLLQVGDIPAVPTNKPYQYILPVGHPINTSLATPINISSPPPLRTRFVQAREDAVRARGELVEVEGRARRASETARNKEHKMRQIKTLSRDQVHALAR